MCSEVFSVALVLNGAVIEADLSVSAQNRVASKSSPQ
jgi:hypothetical protein